jgi:hypothetical protein
MREYERRSGRMAHMLSPIFTASSYFPNSTEASVRIP